MVTRMHNVTHSYRQGRIEMRQTYQETFPLTTNRNTASWKAILSILTSDGPYSDSVCHLTTAEHKFVVRNNWTHRVHRAASPAQVSVCTSRLPNLVRRCIERHTDTRWMHAMYNGRSFARRCWVGCMPYTRHYSAVGVGSCRAFIGTKM